VRRFASSRLRRVLYARPATTAERLVHHGARVLLVLLLAGAIQLLFPITPIPDFPVLEKGMVPERDIIARVSFPIYKSDTELAREREEAALSIAMIYDVVPQVADSVTRRVDAFLRQLDAAADAGGAAAHTRIRQVLTDNRLPSTDEAVTLLLAPRARNDLRNSLHAAVTQDLRAGIAAPEPHSGIASNVRLRNGAAERLVPRDSLMNAAHFFDRAERHLPWSAPRGMAEFQRLLLIRFFEPTIRLNAAATDRERARAQQAVDPIEGQVLRGERVIAGHDRVGDAEIDRLRAYQDQLSRLGQLEPGQTSAARLAGALLFNALVLAIFGLLLFTYRRQTYEDGRHLALLSGVVIAFAAMTSLVDNTEAPAELIPIAFPALVVAMLWDGRMALTLALVLTLLLSGQAPFLGISALFPMALGGAAAALGVRVIRRRAQMWGFIAIIAGAYIAAAFTLGLLRERPLEEMAWSALWGALNGAGCVFVAMGFLPLLEGFARITTDQTLLELADLNGPLLKRLSLEAPGTYAHSISVANMAEAAAARIDANALLARVGSYYHDIGKMVQSQYYIENQPPGRNPHDALKPAASAAIVRSHVIEGLRLAEEYNLPDALRQFIEQHHGTQPIAYFLDRARSQSPGGEINAAEYAYPAPKPQVRETAITMLADSVESASRVLDDPTPASIRALVDRIVNGKIALGQLDESPLTLKEISAIKDQFVKMISGMYHHRIDYPVFPEDPEPATVESAGLT
jgi:putative nucleotidyltransferase with HDIG domain